MKSAAVVRGAGGLAIAFFCARLLYLVLLDLLAARNAWSALSALFALLLSSVLTLVFLSDFIPNKPTAADQALTKAREEDAERVLRQIAEKQRE